MTVAARPARHALAAATGPVFRVQLPIDGQPTSHRRRLTNPAQLTVYDLAAYHGPRRAPWPARLGHFLFVAFVVVFGSDEPTPSNYRPPMPTRVVKAVFWVLVEILIVVFGSDEGTPHAR